MIAINGNSVVLIVISFSTWFVKGFFDNIIMITYLKWNSIRFTAIISIILLLHSHQFSSSKSFPKYEKFFLNLCWGHPSDQFVIFLNFPAFP